jgi:hypothetical protein
MGVVEKRISPLAAHDDAVSSFGRNDGISVGKGESKSRSPSGMTTRKAKAKARAKARQLQQQQKQSKRWALRCAQRMTTRFFGG